MMDTTSKYNSMLQQHSMHPLSTTIPHPSTTLHQQQHSSRNASSTLHQDFPSSPIDFANNEALFMSPLSRNSQIDDFEDLDYQSGLASYQKQHMVSRHPSMPSSNSMDIHPNATTSTTAAAAASSPPNNIPIHPIKQGVSTSSSFYTGNGDYDDISSLAMSAPANIGHFGASSPPSLHYLGGGNPGENTVSDMPMPTTTTSSSSLFIHPHQQQQQHYQPSQQMDSPGSTARSFEDDDYSLQMK
ncbi:hypothetical protein BCR42DRAFT_42076 [Absidia repens]|uniref:Uncharacterized protein n=1 Tax=Absidia repens TaxID=90262 RepID=A0A1X2IG02_9FUNG|nr:hypothetical protein BCR42DRAFT_42076 [Absidia repens]